MTAAKKKVPSCSFTHHPASPRARQATLQTSTVVPFVHNILQPDSFRKSIKVPQVPCWCCAMLFQNPDLSQEQFSYRHTSYYSIRTKYARNNMSKTIPKFNRHPPTSSGLHTGRKRQVCSVVISSNEG